MREAAQIPLPDRLVVVPDRHIQPAATADRRLLQAFDHPRDIGRGLGVDQHLARHIAPAVGELVGATDGIHPTKQRNGDRQCTDRPACPVQQPAAERQQPGQRQQQQGHERNEVRPWVVGLADDGEQQEAEHGDHPEEPEVDHQRSPGRSGLRGHNGRRPLVAVIGRRPVRFPVAGRVHRPARTLPPAQRLRASPRAQQHQRQRDVGRQPGHLLAGPRIQRHRRQRPPC